VYRRERRKKEKKVRRELRVGEEWREETKKGRVVVHQEEGEKRKKEGEGGEACVGRDERKEKKRRDGDTWYDASGWEEIRISSQTNRVMTCGKVRLSLF